MHVLTGELVSYAADHGVRVMFEVDTPAHSASWCAAMPQLCVAAMPPMRRLASILW